MFARSDCSLVVVGTGIKSLSHLTVEAKANIEQADVVLYLVNEPTMKQWIMRANKNTFSLDGLYFDHDKRIDSYSAITHYILDQVEKGQHVCVAIYGHPTLYSKPALDAAIAAEQKGVSTAVLPGISAESCLYADLKIDPGSSGCFSYEATDLLEHRRHIDPACHLLVWQIGSIGATGHLKDHDNANGLCALTEYLLDFYDRDHNCIVYTAAQYPGFMPSIDEVFLADLALRKIPVVSTLYIQPENQGKLYSK